MRFRKVLSTVLLTIILLTQFSFIKFGGLAHAVDQTNEQLEGKFHYNQLDANAKKIYDGIVAMKNNGMLKTGTQNYDLVANGHFTSDEVKSYEINMKKAFDIAKYAFYADYPEMFYVNFEKLSIRIESSNGTYHAYIGAENNENYLTQVFENNIAVENAIIEFDNKVNEIVSEVNNLQIEEGKNEEEKIKYVYNKIANINGDRLETADEGFLTTPYGVLVKGQGVCEGYARAFKTILDKLNITCILVQGLCKSEDGTVTTHMWNCVQLSENTDEKWYKIDVTGAKEHIAVEQVETAEDYKFKYPNLQIEDLGINSVTQANGLATKYEAKSNQTAVEITIPQTRVITIHEDLIITPTVPQTQGIQSYQWYKNGTALEGKTNKVLEISNVTVQDSGDYTLKVTTTAESDSSEVTSKVCKVSVRSFDTTLTLENSQIDLNEVHPGEELDVNINIQNFKNIEKGLYAIEGQLEYSTNVLELVRVNDKMITPQNGWESTTENNETLHFVTTGDNIKTQGVMGKIKFMVKETQNPTQAFIKLKGMYASDTEIDIASEDATLNMTVKKPVEKPEEKEDYITSKVYKIEEKIISRIEPKTTIASFKSNVESQGTLVFKDAKGNVVEDENAILKTGMTLQVGSTLKFTISVTQDINGDGDVTVTDLAKMMAHLVENETLEGVYFKAADINDDSTITITDVAKLQLILVGLPTNE